MANTKPKGMDAVEEAEVLEHLKQMELDARYNTQTSYHSNTEKYPDNLISFAQTHMAYLKKFPAIDPHQYVANLKLITKSFR